MYHCCKAIDKCCHNCCECILNCCGQYCQLIGEIFTTPFSFCTFLSFFVTIIPAILMFVAEGSTYECEQPIKTHLIIQGIINILNFLFCIYLMCKYGYYQKHKQNSEWNQLNIMQKTFHLLLYDFVVCFYIFAIIFFIVWTSIGHYYYDHEPKDSVCFQQDDGFIMTAHLLNLLSTDFFLIFGTFAFLITLTINACEDGSCTCIDTSNCICGIITCGLCYGFYTGIPSCCCRLLTCGLCDDQPKKSTKYIEERKQAAVENKNQYEPERNVWIGQGKTLLGKMKFWGKNPEPEPSQNPYFGNHEMNPINPGIHHGGPPIQPFINNYQPYPPLPPQPVAGYANQAPFLPSNPIMSNPVQPNYNYPGQSYHMNQQNKPFAYNNPQVAEKYHQPPKMEYGFQDPNSGLNYPPPAPPPNQEEKKQFFGVF